MAEMREIHCILSDFSLVAFLLHGRFNDYQRKSPYILVIGIQRMLLKHEYQETKEPMLDTY